MDQSEFLLTLRRAIAAIEATGQRYHLTGGLVASYYGEPRLTQDIDIVIAISEEKLDSLFAALSPHFLINRDAMGVAFAEGGLFQALDQEIFIKIDFHLIGSIPDELNRSVVTELFDGLTVPIASKVDALLSKLIWIRDGSEKSRRDVIGMLLSPDEYDKNLLSELAKTLGVSGLLDELSEEADRLR